MAAGRSGVGGVAIENGGHGGASRVGAADRVSGGKRVALVALARRLAGILFAIWRDETSFEPRKIRALEAGKIRLVAVAPNAA